MLRNPIYVHEKAKRCTHVMNWRLIMLFLNILIFAPAFAMAGPEEDFEEITINLSVSRIGNLEVPAVIIGQQLFLPVRDIFDFLKIQNLPTASFDTIAGFFINPKATFLISKATNQVFYQDKVIQLQSSDLILTENNLYLRSNYFGEIFGLECIFNFRNLSVVMNTKIELPAIKEMKMALMHENMNKLKQIRRADTVIKREFPLFKLGVADWMVMSNRQTEGINNERVALGLGAVVAGGETNVVLNYATDQPFSMKRQFFNWRYVNNDNLLLRQVTVGNIYTGGIASIFYPVRGIQVTNAPTTYRRSFGTYRISNTTEPGWMVELYVNNVLVDYKKADASGFYTFDVPLVYGNSIVKLRFYGPWGEERIKEQNIVIPFNFLPVNQFEYTATAGLVADGENSKFSRIAGSYGLTKSITIGSGLEYLSNVNSGKPMPFLNASFRLSSSLMVTAEHVLDIRSRAILSYRLPSNIQVDVNYTKYKPGQDVVRFSYLEEKKASLSIPLRGKRLTTFSRVSFSQQRFFKYKYNIAEMLLSGQFAGVNANFGTFAQFTDLQNPFVYSSLSATFRLPIALRFTPLIQYDYALKSWRILRGELEKTIFYKGYANLAYEKNKGYTGSSITLGFRYNFSFVQTAFSVRQSRSTSAIYQSARGSLIYNEHTKRLVATDQVSLSRGALMIAPFLDVNCNGRRDAGEPTTIGLNIRINGGILQRKKDGTIMVQSLEAYTDYMIELDKNSFENIAWKMKNALVKVTVEPNHVKLIEVPIAVVGEVSGTVYLNGNDLEGQGRIIINIFNAKSQVVATTVSEPDGFFSYLGLAPGSYTASPDVTQLGKLKLSASPVVSFVIKPLVDGDVVDSLKFELTPYK